MEVSSGVANLIARDREAVVYTHIDKEQIHNHIVINVVSYENGRKYQSAKKDLYRIWEQSDHLYLERELSIVEEPSAEQRYHRAGYGLSKRGLMS